MIPKLFCATPKKLLFNCIPILHPETVFSFRKAVYNGVSLEIYITFDFKLMT